MEPVESRCRRRMAAWTWWRSWTLAQSSGKPPRSESGVQSCSPPCFDKMDMMDTMYILIIDGGHFWHMLYVVDLGNLAADFHQWRGFLMNRLDSVYWTWGQCSTLRLRVFFFSCLHKKVGIHQVVTCFRIPSTRIWWWGTFCSHRPLSGSQSPWV